MTSPLIFSVVALLCLIHFSSAVRMLREENYLGREMENDEEKDTPNIGGLPFPFNFPPFSGGIPNIPFNVPGFNIPGFGSGGIPGFGIPGIGAGAGDNNPFNMPIPGVPGISNPVPGVPSVSNPVPAVPSVSNPVPAVPDVANPITGVPDAAVAPPSPAP